MSYKWSLKIVTIVGLVIKFIDMVQFKIQLANIFHTIIIKYGIIEMRITLKSK